MKALEKLLNNPDEYMLQAGRVYLSVVKKRRNSCGVCNR